MKRKRISSKATIYFAWILPMAILGFWTPVTVGICLTDISIALKTYLVTATLICWVIYLVTRPWELKKVFETEEGLIFKIGKEDKLVRFDQIQQVKSILPVKMAPVVLTYTENQQTKKLKFYPV